MPSFERRASGNAAVGDLLTLTDESTNSRVVIAEGRGALVTSFCVGDRELLYLDEETLLDPAKNVRGGIPVLFPSPGKLDGNAFTWGGRSGALNQHGFARTLPWTAKATTSSVAAVTLGLESNATTRAQYPWDFSAEFAFSLEKTCLRIGQLVRNTSGVPMPYGVGFHPYFRVTDKAHARVDTQATRAFDNVQKRIVPFAGFDLTEKEVDLHLLDHGSTTSALHFADGSRVDLRASAVFSHWVVWTLSGKDFVCVEPWTCPGNALNTGEKLIVLEPGEQKASWVEIAFAG